MREKEEKRWRDGEREEKRERDAQQNLIGDYGFGIYGIRILVIEFGDSEFVG